MLEALRLRPKPLNSPTTMEFILQHTKHLPERYLILYLQSYHLSIGFNIFNPVGTN